MIFDGITNVMEGDSFPNAALAASGNEPPFALCKSVFEKGFLQDVRHNLWEISPG